jgi:hypothetical protein
MRHRRRAVCIDDSGCPRLKRHDVYPIEPDRAAQREGKLRILSDEGDALLVEARRFLVATAPRRSKGGAAAGNRIMAAALESEARLQEAGGASRIGLRYGAVLKDLVEASSQTWSEDVAFALGFWDDWIEAARGRWRVHATVKRAEWPRFARAVARAVRRGAIDGDSDVLELLDRFDPRYRRPRPDWLRGVYGPRAGQVLRTFPEPSPL